MQGIDPQYVYFRRPKHIKVKQVQRFLKENSIQNRDSILIEYFLTYSKLFIFIISQHIFHIKQVDISRQEIYNFIDNYQQEVIDYPSFIENGKKDITNRWLSKLSKYLIEQVANYLKNIDLIYFIPHDKLHYVSLHTLLIDDKPLIKQHKVVYLSSASLLQFYQNNNNVKDLKTCTSFGVSLKEDEQEFLEEAKKIAEIFGTEAKLNVTKEQVLSSNLTHNVLHFSCHGYFYPNDPLSSGIVLKDEEYLTAREIFDLNISSNLVTLSACETAISENKPGDELIGLTRSLLYAGAQSLVVSLWKVHPRASLEIMIEFYTNLKNGEDKATALQNAQIKIRDEWKEKWGEMYAHPFWWAPFVLVGDWR